MKEKKIIAIIPARGGSRSIPNKNIIDFCGKPLIAWTIDQAANSKYISSIYVSTDDEKISIVSSKYGADIIKRPHEIATDSSPSEDALMHALLMVEKKKKIDTVVFLQATSPLRTTKDIDDAIEFFNCNRGDSLFSASVLGDFCVWSKKRGVLESITFDYNNRGMRQERDPYYLENGSIYIFKPEILRKYKNRLGGKILLFFMPYWKSYEIDTVEDFEICEFFMKEKIIGNKKYDCILKNIELIVYDFDGVFTNNKVIVREDGIESVVVSRADGMAINKIREMGITQLILSTEKNKIIESRAKKIGISFFNSIDDKKAFLKTYCNDNNISFKNVIYVGNDLNDLEAMKMIGYPICPADACDEIKNISKLILITNGGEGIARELIKYLKVKK
jgi:YrbI family 3-deoxy-D-manno-octulosonate 8-phosphate phosphatase